MHPVLAYIDPGSGSLIIQVLIASLIAVPFVLRQQIGRLVQRIKGQPAAAERSVAPAVATATDPDPAE